MNAPKYELGKIYDLRFSHEHMPDRIYIKGVSANTDKPYWIYQVYSEVHPWKSIYMTEEDIDKRVSRRSADCYQHPIVQKMYQRGFRFCGNSKEEVAINRANNLKTANYIKHIILCDAVGADGNMLDGELGLWVQYNRSFDQPDVRDKDGCINIK